MRKCKKNSRPYLLVSFRRFAIAVLALAAVGGLTSAHAGSKKSKSFTSASQASQALYEAVKGGDDASIQTILGAGAEVTSSGNQNEDKLDYQGFVNKYQEMHRLVQEPDGNTVLYIGAENWPFPFPLVEEKGKWHFDAAEGSQEVLARDIGRNEITAIKICNAFGDGTDARQDGTGEDGAIRQFASELRNQSDTKAKAIPFQGYYFRIVDKKSAGGGLVAYPAEYGLTGVMTFMVTPSGSVYEDDLGVQTAKAAQQVDGNPTEEWVTVRRTSM